MAIHGHAPKIFTRINRFGIPWVAVTLYGLFMCLGFMTLADSANVVFNWLQDLISIATLVNWMCICVVYLRFYYGCKKQGINRSAELPWAAPFQPYTTWASLFLFTVLLFTGGFATFIKGHWVTETFVSSYINIPIFLVLYYGYKWTKGTTIIPLAEIPIRDFIQIWRDNPEPEPTPKKGWRKLNILWS